MTIKEVKNYLASLTSHIMFEYNGKPCGIDPLSRNKFNMWYGTEGISASSIDDVMTAKIFDNLSLEDIWGNITALEF